MTTWLAWRLCKFIGVVLLTAGVFGSIGIDDPDRRRVTVYGVGTLGWLCTWVGGYMMMKMTGRSIEPWILGAMVASLVSLHAAYRAASSARPSDVATLLASGGLLGALVTMVLRPMDWGSAGASVTLGGVVGAGFGLNVRRSNGAALGRDDLWSWFKWMARLEGVSLLLLLFVHVPLKRIYDVALDGGTGTFGWIHGSFVLIYAQAVLALGASWGWNAGSQALGIAAALVPTGTFWFERRMQ
ncbi:MAG: DUF3817 domain-containing protein [Myxococcota bacterium]